MIRVGFCAVKKSNARRTGPCVSVFEVETTRGVTLLQSVTKELDVVWGGGDEGREMKKTESFSVSRIVYTRVVIRLPIDSGRSEG